MIASYFVIFLSFHLSLSSSFFFFLPLFSLLLFFFFILFRCIDVIYLSHPGVGYSTAKIGFDPCLYSCYFFLPPPSACVCLLAVDFALVPRNNVIANDSISVLFPSFLCPVSPFSFFFSPPSNFLSFSPHSRYSQYVRQLLRFSRMFPNSLSFSSFLSSRFSPLHSFSLILSLFSSSSPWQSCYRQLLYIVLCFHLSFFILPPFVLFSSFSSIYFPFIYSCCRLLISSLHLLPYLFFGYSCQMLPSSSLSDF